ncbi:MAG: hypothetical protein M1838_005130 [Thelocarpon superellum]|nr:MAG: hypothetical protein M1838_005130 [Thelocarpon superellum]
MPWSNVVAAISALLAVHVDVVNTGTQYFLTYSHGTIADGNTSLIAVDFGVDNLSRALQAAIEEAANHTMAEELSTQFNVSARRLSLFVRPSLNVPTPLTITWRDFASNLQILLNDAQQIPGYQTLPVGIVADQEQNSVLEVVIIPELILAETAAVVVDDLTTTTSATSSLL